MMHLLSRKRTTPIGVDIGARGVKLVQLSADLNQGEASRWEFTSDDSPQPDEVVKALQHAYAAGNFRGRDVVLCLGNDDLFMQNIRVPKSEQEMDRRIVREAVERLPFPAAQAELRFLQTADVRQAEAVMREVIVLACLRQKIDARLALVDQAGFMPVGLEIEPLALARSYARQQRRDEEKSERALLAHVGHSRTVVVIVENGNVQFVKYSNVAGRDIDQAVADHLHLSPADAASLRRHSSDSARDGEVDESDLTASIARAARPVYEKLAQDLIKCVRYYSVTFRGPAIERISLSGGEANETLRDWLSQRMNVKCDLSDAFRGVSHRDLTERCGNWDIAVGLALRENN